jgi:Tfp pilus assembly protein PilW
MATKTRNDLVNQALRNLGVLAAGQTADAEDFQAADGHVDQVIASLSARDIVTVDDDDWFDPLAVLVADDAAMEFGLPGVPASSSDPNPVLDAENRLRLMVRGRPTYEPLKVDYF